MKKLKRYKSQFSESSDYTSSEIKNYTSFTKQLAVLSKKYGVVIQSVGGVQIGDISKITYDSDITSGDLLPTVEFNE